MAHGRRHLRGVLFTPLHDEVETLNRRHRAYRTHPWDSWALSVGSWEKREHQPQPGLPSIVGSTFSDELFRRRDAASQARPLPHHALIPRFQTASITRIPGVVPASSSMAPRAQATDLPAMLGCACDLAQPESALELRSS